MEKTMDIEFVMDEHGKSAKVKMVVDYADYVEIAKKLNITLVSPHRAKEKHRLDWSSLAENANSLLDGLISLAGDNGL